MSEPTIAPITATPVADRLLESRVLDEAAATLRLVRSPATASMALGRVNDLVQATGRVGANAAGLRAGFVPPQLSVGVIVWSDTTEDDPTVIAHRSPVTLARMMAETLYEQLHDSPGFEGAAEFLDEHPPPADWTWPEDVDDWLEALRATTPFPAFSFHQIPTVGGADGTNRPLVSRLLARALREREHALEPDTSAQPTRPAGRHAAGRDVSSPYLTGDPTRAK